MAPFRRRPLTGVDREAITSAEQGSSGLLTWSFGGVFCTNGEFPEVAFLARGLTVHETDGTNTDDHSSQVDTSADLQETAPEFVRLRDFAANVTSQCGEDGMVAEMLRRLDLRNGWAVEFGANDGETLSNTYSLWHDQGWHALLIEGNRVEYEKLLRTVRDFHNVNALLAWVSDTGASRLDSLLSNAGVPSDFGLLSIDIDGDDYYIWAGMRSFSPKIVIIEYNVSFPPHISYVQPRGTNCGSSARSICELANSKGYRLVDLTPTNLIFVRMDLQSQLGLVQEPLSSLFLHECLVFAWSDMRGRIQLETPAMWGFRPPVRLSGTMREAGRQSIARSARRIVTLGRRAMTLDRRLYESGLQRLMAIIRRG